MDIRAWRVILVSTPIPINKGGVATCLLIINRFPVSDTFPSDRARIINHDMLDPRKNETE